MNTEFHDIPGYEGLYKINRDGVIVSSDNLRYQGNGVWGKHKGRVIRATSDKNKYLIVGLYKNKVCKKLKVHRILAIVFIPNPLNLKEVNHINANKTDNSIENLEWISHKDNMLHATRIGKMVKSEQHRNNISKALMGKVKSQEHLDKIKTTKIERGLIKTI